MTSNRVHYNYSMIFDKINVNLVILSAIKNYKNYTSKQIENSFFRFQIFVCSERRMQMKKEHDLTERLAFHLITSRTTALNIATDGLSCEQLTFPIEKYLGKFIENSPSVVHLSVYLYQEILKMEFIYHVDPMFS